VPAWLYVSGNRSSAASGQLNAIDRLTTLRDETSGQQFFVDIGAAVSVLLHQSKCPLSQSTLTGVGSVTKKLCFGAKMFITSFILAAVSGPILGSDFLSAHRLLVDTFNRAVLCSCSLEPLAAPCVVFCWLYFVNAL
jgi:hypothetical protein